MAVDKANSLVGVPMLNNDVQTCNPMLTTYLQCDSICLAFEVNTGASVSVVDQHFYRHYFYYCSLQMSHRRLRCASNLHVLV